MERSALHRKLKQLGITEDLKNESNSMWCESWYLAKTSCVSK